MVRFRPERLGVADRVRGDISQPRCCARRRLEQAVHRNQPLVPRVSRPRSRRQKERRRAEDSQPLKAKRAEIDAAIEKTSEEKIGATPVSQLLAQRFWGFAASGDSGVHFARVLPRAEQVRSDAGPGAFAAAVAGHGRSGPQGRRPRTGTDCQAQRPDRTAEIFAATSGRRAKCACSGPTARSPPNHAGRRPAGAVADQRRRHAAANVDDTGEDTGRKPWRPARSTAATRIVSAGPAHPRNETRAASSQQSGDSSACRCGTRTRAIHAAAPRGVGRDHAGRGVRQALRVLRLEFDDDKSVPTLNFFAPGWPASATPKFACGFRETAAAAAVVQAVPPRPGVSQTLEAGSPKVKFDVRWERGAAGMDCRVIVVGRSESDACRTPPRTIPACPRRLWSRSRWTTRR